jgi:hypothetical protein
MGAITIAFDTIIVGALALPWFGLVVHLFFLEGESRLAVYLRWIKRLQASAVAGVLLFAAAYTLGAAVARVAQDVFNDDDLYLHIPIIHRWVRVGTTEDRIVTSVYCERQDNELLRPGVGNPALTDKIRRFQCQKLGSCEKDCEHPPAEKAIDNGACDKIPAPGPFCSQTLSWLTPPDLQWKEEMALNETGADIFGLEEAAVLLKGEDETQRVRQLHDQIMVLRGAAFNAIVACSLCLFVWGVSVRRRNSRSKLGYAITLAPACFIAVALLALKHHFHADYQTQPPYMEFSLLLLGGTGALLLWRRLNGDGPNEPRLPEGRWAALTLLSAVLVIAAVLGWWGTEVIYAREVIYHYDAISARPADAASSKTQ